MKYAALLAALLLAACGTTPPQPAPPPDVPVIQPKTQVVIPTGLTDACPKLQPLTKQSYTQGEFTDALKVWFDQYDLCAGRFQKFVTVVAPALNIKEVDPATPASGPSAQNPPSGQ
jgi:hypothetical protein